MSDDQKDAELGRVMRESKENTENTGRLFAECSRLGARLGQVAEGLAGHPEAVVLDGQGSDIRYARTRINILPNDFDVEKLTKLTNDYRQALATKELLDTQLTQLGFPPASRRQ